MKGLEGLRIDDLVSDGSGNGRLLAEGLNDLPEEGQSLEFTERAYHAVV